MYIPIYRYVYILRRAIFSSFAPSCRPYNNNRRERGKKKRKKSQWDAFRSSARNGTNKIGHGGIVPGRARPRIRRVCGVLDRSRVLGKIAAFWWFALAHLLIRTQTRLECGKHESIERGRGGKLNK